MLSETLKKWLMTGVGLAVVTVDKIEELVKDLVQQGQVTQEEGEELLSSLLARADKERQELSARISQEARRLVESMGFVRAEEMEELRKRVLELEARLARIEEED
ncbi:MAG: phasin family protein [Limnochordia bacterium]|jgi:polyhydroxyalkanoate synthesis regulator phasin